MAQELIDQQLPQDYVLQNAVTANGNGVPGVVAGYAAVLVEINNTDSAGTCTVTLQGSFDGTNWYNLAYAPADNAASLTYAVTGISVLASAKHYYVVRDYVYRIRAVVSAATGFVSGNVTVTAHCRPV